MLLTVFLVMNHDSGLWFNVLSYAAISLILVMMLRATSAP
jgi:hypothetical protein